VTAIARATTSVPAREVRLLGAAMLGIAAVRPLVPVELVPPCPMRSMVGIPCPMCGMTRGVTALVHGDVGDALFLSPGSLVAVAFVVLLIAQWRAERLVLPVWTIGLLLALLWSWQLLKYSTGRAL
jgi:hypothetical protein